MVQDQIKNKSKISQISFGGVSFTEKAIFAKHLAVMLRAGLTLNEALQISVESSSGKFKKIIAGVLSSIQSGNSFSNSLAAYPKTFPAIFISAAYAGEKSGTLVENLENISIELEKEKKLKDKIRGAMAYPMVVLVATVVLGLSLSYFVLPKIVPLFKGLRTDLPFTTKSLIWFSEIIQNYGLQVFLGLFLSVVFLIWLIRANFMKPVTHLFILKFPLLNSISRNSNLARFSRTLAMLIKSGVSITESLEITIKAMPNFYYRRSLTKVLNRVKSGTTLSEQLSRFPSLYPVITTRMVSVGEQSGNIEETLFYLSEFYEEEVDNATKTMSTIVEPVLLLFIGLVVGFLALSIITPIYEITGNIRG